MVSKHTPGTIIADLLIGLVVGLMTLSCLLPLLNMLAVSFSSSEAATANLVGLWPRDFTVASYNKLLKDTQFGRSFGISALRAFAGTALSLILVLLMAYPLSKSKREFRSQPVYMNLVIFSMLFNGGLIPTYIVVFKLGLVNTFWSLILPGAVSSWNVILMMNAFRAAPKSLEESALIDGATQWSILFKIYLPVCLPTFAMIALFSVVGHWNDYFSGLIYITQVKNYPLQTYIQQLNVDVTRISDPQKMIEFMKISTRTLNSAKIVVATVPLLVIYPFLQRYFVTGIVVGSVKE